VSTELRIAVFVGIALALVFLIGRTVRHKGVAWPVTDLFEAITLAIAPLPVPGGVEMVGKAFDSDDLPILNAAEERISLGFGGALLLAAIIFSVVVGTKRGWRTVNRSGN
jgi:hypothetical protein